jgi:hygromycin-B 4-O-kinase
MVATRGRVRIRPGRSCPSKSEIIVPAPVGLEQAAAFLADRYAGRAAGVTELGGGDWSRAYSFDLDGRSLVARFGAYREDFEKDRMAMAFAGPDLPVPEVIEIGSAFGGCYALSERSFGVFLESLDRRRLALLMPALLRALDALRLIPVPAGPVPACTGPVWPAGVNDAPSSWRDWLTVTLEDVPGGRVSGWRARLAESADLNGLFIAGEREMRALVSCCPEIRHVVHLDLLNRNVLVSEDGTRLEAVFDWGCSVFGDFLYDVAWFTFWAPWHRGLHSLGFRDVVTRHYQATGLDVPAMDRRLRCYELHIGLTHLAYCTFAGRDESRREVATRMAQILG